MGKPSFEASNAIIYLTYGLFLILGTSIAWRMRKQPKTDFLAGNRTQTALPLAFNFVASGLGSGILFTYPELGTIAGVQGVIVYALASSLPFLVFGALGPIIRRRCPQGFVLTEWTRQRYGVVTMLFLSFMTLVTLFLYMVAELSALGQVVGALAGVEGLPPIIVQCIVTTVYTSLGGFKISFLTDVIQGVMVVGLVVIATVTISVKTEIKSELVGSSGLTKPTLLGWQLLYILPVAVLTNAFFLSSFWLRTFSSKSDRDLWLGVSAATVAILLILTLVGSTGFLAAWSGVWPGDPPSEGSLALFMLLEQLPNWIIGIVLVMVVSLSTAAFDSFQSAIVSSASNDLFRNKLNIWVIRGFVVTLIVPTIIVALKASSILQIYLVSDLLSASTIPVLCIGLIPGCWWWRGFEVVIGGLGGILTVFFFGAVYYHDLSKGAKLLLLEDGLYADDWSVFGAFVAAPLGGLIWGFAALTLRLSLQLMMAKCSGQPFTSLDRPLVLETGNDDANVEDAANHAEAGKFF